MRPRILLRTHYQADEPRAIIAAITECTSPTESKDEDAIAERLVRWARGSGYALSTPGAVYAVGNARSLGFLNKSNRWTATGLAISYLQKEFPLPSDTNSRTLSSVEQRLYLRQYLVGAGALVIKFGHWILAQGTTTDEQLRIESVVEHLLVEALDEYLTIATEIRDRTVIRRERERLSRSKYVSSTKRHKRYPLLTTMERLCLLDVERDDNGRTAIAPDRAGRLTALLQACPDLSTLERLIRDGSMNGALDKVLDRPCGVEPARRPLLGLVIVSAYLYAHERGLQACPLAYLDDVLYAASPLISGYSGTLPSVEETLQSLHRHQPRAVRFHVDRRGQRAYVLLDKDALLAVEKSGWQTPES